MAKQKATDVTDVRATYLIPSDIKEEIEAEAQEKDLNASQVVRRIFRDWFKKKKTSGTDGMQNAQ